MVTVKQVSPKEVIDEVMSKAIRAVRIASSKNGHPDSEAIANHPLLKFAQSRRALLSRVRNERKDYCDCQDCRADGRHAEEIALMDAKTALAFKDLRDCLFNLRNSMTMAQVMLEEATNLLKMNDLLSMCPDQ